MDHENRLRHADARVCRDRIEQADRPQGLRLRRHHPMLHGNGQCGLSQQQMWQLRGTLGVTWPTDELQDEQAVFMIESDRNLS